jgi:hypothetical protein
MMRSSQPVLIEQAPTPPRNPLAHSAMRATAAAATNAICSDGRRAPAAWQLQAPQRYKPRPWSASRTAIETPVVSSSGGEWPKELMLSDGDNAEHGVEGALGNEKRVARLQADVPAVRRPHERSRTHPRRRRSVARRSSCNVRSSSSANESRHINSTQLAPGSCFSFSGSRGASDCGNITSSFDAAHLREPVVGPVEVEPRHRASRPSPCGIPAQRAGEATAPRLWPHLALALGQVAEHVPVCEYCLSRVLMAAQSSKTGSVAGVVAPPGGSSPAAGGAAASSCDSARRYSLGRTACGGRVAPCSMSPFCADCGPPFPLASAAAQRPSQLIERPALRCKAVAERAAHNQRLAPACSEQPQLE